MQIRRIMGILLILLAAAMVTVTPIIACPTGPTSLKVKKTITSVTETNGLIIIEGYIELQNDPLYPAVIIWVRDYVEAKYKNNPWEMVYGPVELWSFGEIPAGGTTTIHFTLEIAKGNFKAYRNVVEVLLWDTRGYRDYHNRASFSVP